MAANIIWLSNVVLEAAVLFRGWKAGLLRRYYFFYAFLAWILITEIVRFWSYRQSPSLYQIIFWDTRFVTIAASYAVCVEIFKRALRHNRGVARAGQRLLLVVFVFAISYAASDFVHGRHSSVARAAADLGAYLSYIEALLLLIMLWLFTRYRISFGWNLLGLTLGYSLWVGIEVMIVILLFLPDHGASMALRKIAPIVFLVALIIWCASLWALQPEPLRPVEGAIDKDYGLLAERTRVSLAHLSQAARRLRP